MDEFSLLDSAPCYVYALDTELRYIYLNRLSLETGYGGLPLDKVLGRTGAEFFPSVELEPLLSHDRWVLAHDQPIQVYEALVSRALFSMKWPLHDEEGNVSGVAAISFDITPIVEERIRGGQDMDLMVDMVKNTGAMAEALSRMIGRGT